MNASSQHARQEVELSSQHAQEVERPLPPIKPSNMPDTSWSCPCHSWDAVEIFCRFKERLQERHPCKWIDLKRGRGTITMGPGETHFFLFRRMQSYLVNRVKLLGTSDAIFLTNLTTFSKAKEGPFRMSVCYTRPSSSSQSGSTTVWNRVDTMCLKHKVNQTEQEAVAFIACPSNTTVEIYLVVGLEAADLV